MSYLDKRSIYGSKVGDTNMIFRLLMVSFAGIAAMAVLVSWRAQLLLNAEYAEFPKTHSQVRTVIRAETDLERQQRE